MAKITFDIPEETLKNILEDETHMMAFLVYVKRGLERYKKQHTVPQQQEGGDEDED